VECDVVVVGAGLAGLRCAQRLARAGRVVMLLEGADAVGGRARTDTVDGFLLDRGFQVLNPAYPAVRRWVDVPALHLQTFGAGVLVRRDRGLVELSHPLRHPSGLLPTLRSGLVTPAATLTLARWAAPSLLAPRRMVRGADRPLREGLDRAGVRGSLRSEVLEPFLAGVLAEDRGETSEAFTRLLVRMFVLGVPGVPARGIRALPEQLAGEVRRSGAEVRLGDPVVTVHGPASGGVGRGSVELAGGAVLSARAVVVAVGPQAVGALVDLPVPRTKGLQTWWFAADEAPTRSTMLAVDGRRRGPAVNTAVVSNAAPSYAPPGQHLVQVTCLLPSGGGPAGVGSGSDAPGEAEVRRHAGEIYGVDARPWRLVRRDDIPHALPEQPAPLRTRSPARLSDGVYVCGDHRDTASIQGALVSGNRVADAVLAHLAGR
jgi:glycine/D-amino acid oxidase-like deaminating enzyme